MAKPHVFMLIGDCLRAASVTPDTAPLLSACSKIEFTHCYSPSTWTRPSHASLYSQQTPVDHEVTRRGDMLDHQQARLPTQARKAGYRTALFSENPTFSTQTGFNRGIDYVDDGIHRKRFVSPFSPDAHVENIDLDAAITLFGEIGSRPNKLANAANLVYGFVAEFSDNSDTAYPHHGERVLNHLQTYISRNAEQPLFCLTNLLDTHNPHHAPPEVGAKKLGLSVPNDERCALAAANDDRLYMLENAELPEKTHTLFDSWQEVFARRKEIYDTQIRYLDHIVKQWSKAIQRRVLEESLVVVTGDHGQLFGAEGQLGHQVSLHPHGIHVPLYVFPPASWETGVKVTTPVSWIGLSHGLSSVVNGSVTGTEGFIDAVVERSQSGGRVVVAVDGPTWDVTALRERYDDEAVDDVCVRKVGFITDESMTVYESHWDETEIKKVVYGLVDGSREFRDEQANALPDDDRYTEWLQLGEEVGLDAETSSRLEKLGYL